jgi:exosome complex component RRP42
MSYTSKEHIIASLKKGHRLDGRKPDQFRKITIETGFIATAEGSARVKCGDTEILAGVKMGMGKPYPDTPNSGVLMVGAELLPISNPLFESGPPSTESIELARVIDRGIRESKTIDANSLCIKPGEQVWMVNVDLCPLNTDGNLIDLGALAAIAALKTTHMPAVVDGKVDYHQHTDEQLPVNGVPIPITVIKVGDMLLVDPTADEFAIADARLTVTTQEDGSLCALQKGGESSLTIAEISTMIDLAGVKAKELRDLLVKSIGK